MAELKTTYLDDVLDVSSNERRKYQMITNDDGTVSFVDVTDYTQVGDSFGAKDINSTNGAINDLFNTKQNLLNIGTFSGNIDLIGEDGGLPSTSSACCLENASGTMPSTLGMTVKFKRLETIVYDNQNATQELIIYSKKKVSNATFESNVYKRNLYDGTWLDWELLANQADVVTLQNRTYGMLKPVLAWENYYPTTEFPEQALNIDCTNAEGYSVVFKTNSYLGVTSQAICPFNETQSAVTFLNLDNPVAEIYFSHRQYYADKSTNTIGFTNAKFRSIWGGTTETTRNTDLIPYKIYKWIKT